MIVLKDETLVKANASNLVQKGLEISNPFQQSEPVLTVEKGSDISEGFSTVRTNHRILANVTFSFVFPEQSEPVLTVEKGSDISGPFSTVGTGFDC